MKKSKWKAFDHDAYTKHCQAIAQGALTNSKRAESFIKGVYPIHFVRQQGAFSWDSFNNRYIDYTAALGTSILGFRHEGIQSAIRGQLQNGVTFSIATPLEDQCAEKVKELVPFVERVKFLKTGSEACAASLRIARAHTKREYVISDGYHGWSDEFVSLTEPAAGVVRANRISKMAEGSLNHATAAVIVEPFVTDISQERIDYLRRLRRDCDSVGALLIFDEVITGFRFPGWTASRYAGVEPDLILLGKAIANGMPLSCVAGKASVMDNPDYFVSSTFAGETLSLAAGIETLSLLQTKFDMKYLWGKGAQFMLKFNSIYPDGLKIEGYPTRGVFKGQDHVKALFFQECCKAGLFFGASWFFNFSHIEHIDETIQICSDVLGRIKTGSVQLEGEAPVAPFAQRVRG